MCEGLSTINGPIPPHPMFTKDFQLNLSSARSTTSACEGPSKISGPIISHFENNSRVVDYNVVPKVRGNGNANFNADKKGNGVGMLIELQGRALSPKRRGMFDNEHQKNYIASNAFKIKQLMRKVKEREAAQKDAKASSNNNTSLYGPVATPVKAFWKSEKYKDVPSKLKESLSITQPLAPREPHNFLRAHSRTGSRPQTARQSPKRNDGKELSEKKFVSKDDFDFLKHNQKVAQSVQLKKAPSMENLRQVQEKMQKDFDKYQEKSKGKVPQYLEKRNEEIKKAQIEYYKNLPDPDCPPGHRKLPSNEKEETLNKLKETYKRLLAELNSLPIRNDTFRIQTTKSDYEKKLTELDEAIKIFSKPKVFVKID